jgi:hypothetical protein
MCLGTLHGCRRCFGELDENRSNYSCIADGLRYMASYAANYNIIIQRESIHKHIYNPYLYIIL